MKKQISKILIKWGMPTRQVAINEIIKMFELLVVNEINACRKRGEPTSQLAGLYLSLFKKEIKNSPGGDNNDSNIRIR